MKEILEQYISYVEENNTTNELIKNIDMNIRINQGIIIKPY